MFGFPDGSSLTLVVWSLIDMVSWSTAFVVIIPSIVIGDASTTAFAKGVGEVTMITGVVVSIVNLFATGVDLPWVSTPFRWIV